MNTFKTIKLSNGATVLTIPMKNTSTTTVILFFGAGSRYETPNIAGSSHLFEHLLFKGTKKRPTPKEIAEVIESKGGILNAYTDRESTGYWCKVPAGLYQKGIEVLIDMAKEPLLRKKDLEMEKNVVYEEIKAYLDSPDSRASNKADENLWPNQPMGMDIAGSVDTVEATSRSDLVKYLNKQYTASNAVLAVSGNLDESRVKITAEKCFEGFREGKPKKFKDVNFNNSGPIVVFDKMETNQAHITIALEGLAIRDKNKYASTILSVILGGGMTSRLFEQVREKRGLAYSVWATSHPYSDCGAFYIDAVVAPKNVEKTIQVITDEIKDMRKDLSNYEINNAKDLIKGRMMMQFEDSRAVAMNYGSQYLLTKEIEPFEKSMNNIDQVTKSDIEIVSDFIFKNSSAVVSIAGATDEIPNFSKNLTLF